jgi:hypothetical protein
VLRVSGKHVDADFYLSTRISTLRTQGLWRGAPLSVVPVGGAAATATGSRADLPSVERNDLNCLEVHERAVVGDDRVQLGKLGRREIALRLKQLERGRQPRR